MPTWSKWICLLGVFGFACTQEPARVLPSALPSQVLERGGEATARESRTPLKTWPPFPALLWFPPGSQYTPERLAELKSLGIDGVHVDGRDSPEQVVQGGLSFYSGDAPGKGTLHLRASAYENALAETNAKTGPIRPSCFNDSQVRTLQLEKLARALDVHLPYAPLG